MVFVLILNVALFGVTMGFLCWFVPRVIRQVVRSEFNRIVTQFKALCPVAAGILGRVQTLEAKQSQTEEWLVDGKREIVRLDNDVRAVQEHAEAERVKPRRADDMGMAASWGGR